MTINIEKTTYDLTRIMEMKVISKITVFINSSRAFGQPM